MTRLTKPARFLLGILVFAVVGPPVGGVAAWLGMGAAALASPVPFVAGSWGEGMAPALATGVVTALAAWRGLASWIVPAVASALVTALFIAASAGGDWAAMLRAAPVLMPPAIVAALVCWLLTRRLFRR
jgi:hypothetical protein